MADTDKPRSYLLEATLELGRNWALGLAIASAGTIAFYTETVTLAPGLEKTVGTACLLAAVLWNLLAVIRFDEGLTRRVSGRKWPLQAATWTLFFVLTCVGGSLAYLIAMWADNSGVVRLCEEGAARNSPVAEFKECKRLWEQREAKFAELEGRAEK